VYKYNVGFINESLVDVHLQNDSIGTNYEKSLTALKLIYHERYNIFSQNKEYDSAVNCRIFQYSILDDHIGKFAIKKSLRLKLMKKNWLTRISNSTTFFCL
jgi:hypothetical protein